MRILVLQDADWTKKGPHQQHHLMELLSKRGHEIHVVGFDQLWTNQPGLISERGVIPECCRFYDGANIKFIRTRFIRLPFIDYLTFFTFVGFDIDQEIEEFKPDIIVSFTSIISSYWGAKKAEVNDIPYIYYWTDVIHTLLPVKALQPVAIQLEKKIISKSTLVLAINEVLREKVISLGANEASTRVIPGGIDFKRFDPSIDARDIRDKYGIKSDDTVLLFMGWLYDFSGLKEVIQEFIRSSDQCSKLKLLIVGEGGYYSEIKELVSNGCMGDKIIFTGWRPYAEIPRFVASSDICLLPAHCNDVMRDIVPIKLYEYLAMHKPVIATQLPGVMREFGDNSGIMYVDRPENVIPTALSLSCDEMNKYRQKAIEFIKNYDWDRLVIEFEKILHYGVNLKKEA